MLEWLRSLFTAKKPAPKKKRKPRRAMHSVAHYEAGEKYALNEQSDGWHWRMDRPGEPTFADAIEAVRAGGGKITREPVKQEAPTQE